MDPDIDTVVSGAYTEGLDELPLAELRARREAARRLENAVSYVRRLAHGRLDIVGAELERRGRDGDGDADLVAALRSSPGGRAVARNGPEFGIPTRAVGELEPTEAADPFVAMLDDAVSAGFIANVDDHDDDELVAALGRLGDFESAISARRRELHAVLDRVQAEFVRRYRDDGVDVESVISS